jgi:predicted permease
VRVAANFAGEAVILAVCGGLAGTALAYGLVHWFGFSVAELPRLATLAIDGRALAFAVIATFTVALACSLAPLLRARDTNAQSALQSRGAGTFGASRMRNAFVVAQVALSLMLMVAASLLLRTFESMASNTGGIRPDGVATFTLQLPASRYGTEPQRTDFARALIERLGAQPGVTNAALISLLPFSGGGAQSGVGPVGGTREEERRTDVAAVTPDYFRVMGIDIIRGRTFSDADHAASTPVVVVDERFAASMWPAEDAIGKRVAGWGKDEWTVVGVVRHVKNYGVSAESRQEMYAPYAQRPSYRVWAVVKTPGDAGRVITAARAAVKATDPLLPVYGVRTMREVVDATVAGPKLAAFLSAGYALTALLVVIIGIHGAIAYLVHRRTREIGVRVALGASRRGVIRLVVSQSLRLTGLGVLIGVSGGIALTRLIRDQLYGISPLDIPTFVGAALAMVLAGVFASAIPAWRALRVSPLLALTDE